MKEIKSTYQTLEKRSEGLYKEKGSKFIGIAQTCLNEDSAKELLETWNKEHHQARHLCYAYKFGIDGKQHRANDDGEPNNSAGAPILGQLDSFNLTNTLIGVVRYYGGTKLGVGGLINAYRSAAKEAILNGKIITVSVYHWLSISFEYIDMPQIMEFLKNKSIEIKEKEFTDTCTLKIRLELNVAQAHLQELKKFNTIKITDLGNY